MRRAALFVASCLILGWVITPAHAQQKSVHAPTLDPVASEIAGQPLTVQCFSSDPADADPDAEPDAWGYTYPYNPPNIYLDKRACAGARALQTGAMLPLWQLALGALVLTHEAYHQKVTLADWRRLDEAQTECRAIKRVPETLRELGASPALVDAVLPWAVLEHYKISTFDAYDYPSCRVPGMDWWG